jgi:hypothetical protein
MKTLGIKQKMIIIDLDRVSRKKDLVEKVIAEALSGIQTSEGNIEEKQKRMDFHNRFLENLYFFYKENPDFSNQIDALRGLMLTQLKPSRQEAFRFISSGGFAITTPFAMEFAARSGPKPLIANPFILDDVPFKMRQKTGQSKEEAYYFMDYSPLYKSHNKEMVGNPSGFGSTINSSYQREGDYRLMGGTHFLRQILRQIFIYNELVRFVSEKNEVQYANPEITQPQITMFFLPGKDFIRPDKEEFYADMRPEQLFQTVGGITDEAWQRDQEIILKRYAQLALEGKIDPESFMEHLAKMMKVEFNKRWYHEKTQ